MKRYLNDKAAVPTLQMTGDRRVNREGVEWDTNPVSTECHHVGKTPSELRKDVLVGRNPNSDKGEGVKCCLGMGMAPGSSHPEM